MANSGWDSVEALPDGLDVAQAVVYRENGELVLGGRWLVWWERPDGRWQRSVFKPEVFTGPSWSRVEA